jgi:thiosulfate/3-mercaptopyruvate sulfurtransferase
MFRQIGLITLILSTVMIGTNGSHATRPARRAAIEDSWKSAREIAPAELVKKLAGPKASRPSVFQVGFRTLYDGGHIPGAIFAGPASTPDGLASLKKAAQTIPRDKEVVIYCGCCPMAACPNVRPAYEALHEMRFKQLEVLNLPQDFAHDWMDKNYPVEREH